jgi:hypothetical protein
MYCAFLTSALVRGDGLASRPYGFTPVNHWIGAWVDPRARLDEMEKLKFFTLLRLELRPPCCKLEDRRFETRYGELISSVYLILPAALGPGSYLASNRIEYQK